MNEWMDGWLDGWMNFVRWYIAVSYLVLVIISYHIISHHITSHIVYVRYFNTLPFSTSFTFLSHFEKFHFTLCIKAILRNSISFPLYFLSVLNYIIVTVFSMYHHIIILNHPAAYGIISSFITHSFHF